MLLSATCACDPRYLDSSPTVQWTSNDPTYGHWAWTHYAQQAAGNGYLCAAAYANLAYDKYIGSSNSTEVANQTL